MKKKCLSFHLAKHGPLDTVDFYQSKFDSHSIVKKLIHELTRQKEFYQT